MGLSRHPHVKNGGLPPAKSGDWWSEVNKLLADNLLHFANWTITIWLFNIAMEITIFNR